jgi:hypothetical protein
MELHLSKTSLNSVIPESIGSMQQLKVFEAYECQLTGPVPSSIGVLIWYAGMILWLLVVLLPTHKLPRRYLMRVNPGCIYLIKVLKINARATHT